MPEEAAAWRALEAPAAAARTAATRRRAREDALRLGSTAGPAATSVRLAAGKRTERLAAARDRLFIGKTAGPPTPTIAPRTPMAAPPAASHHPVASDGP